MYIPTTFRLGGARRTWKGLLRLGQLDCADGSGPRTCVVQWAWVKTDPHTGESTLLWSRDSGTNEQVYTSPFYLVARWVHLYGCASAYRPYTATTFSESCPRSFRHWMQWTDREYRRRLFRAEALRVPSDINYILPKPVQRLGARRIPPARNEACQRSGEPLEDARLREIAEGIQQDGFETDSEVDQPPPDAASEVADRKAKRKALAEWWLNPTSLVLEKVHSLMKYLLFYYFI